MGGDFGVFGPHDTVDEADGEIQPARVAQDVGETFACGVGGVRGCFGQPATHERDGLLDHGGIDGVGGGPGGERMGVGHGSLPGRGRGTRPSGRDYE